MSGGSPEHIIMPASDDAAITDAPPKDVDVAAAPTAAVKSDLDEWGLPLRKIQSPAESVEDEESEGAMPSKGTTAGKEREQVEEHKQSIGLAAPKPVVQTRQEEGSDSESDEFKDATSTPQPTTPLPKPEAQSVPKIKQIEKSKSSTQDTDSVVSSIKPPSPSEALPHPPETEPETKEDKALPEEKEEAKHFNQWRVEKPSTRQTYGEDSNTNGVSEWSHQQLAPKQAQEQKVEEDEWQTMPAFAPYDIYDDDNRLIAREAAESDDEAAAYSGLGGAGNGYTRVQLDEDAQSATSLDENTQYLFKEMNTTSAAGPDDDEQRDAVSQMQATKDLLTEGQRIAYVGMTRLALSAMLKQAQDLEGLSKGSKKDTAMAAESMLMWSQKMMVRLYAHMDISTPEQIMIEQLANHGVVPKDLTPTLMQNARVKNPMAEKEDLETPLTSPRPSSISSTLRDDPRKSISSHITDEESASPPPPYLEHEGDDLPEVRTPSQLPTSKNIDIDLRWTVLCDLFLTLIADSIYDARSRVLLERVGEEMDVPWLEICRFEKRVTDALEMQQAAEKENWNEDDHKENRRKKALKKRYLMMGLATVGGSLVIGLSAGLLAPVIGAGLAAGFTTIGVAGTSGFLAGAGGAAIITSSAAASGGIIAVRAADRRTGAVKTFEYRPLHNNKRVNLIVTVSGWMTGKIDDVRLPYSTVDPIMGDIYSVLWEPEMLQSMGDTINILATEVRISHT
jgi:hypothetical protein